ncbi:MAG: hypothetical protein JKY56_13340, partial [Kofleriaceae bacterium]|nr:hypothetical protein [Kofleriaceae bacterium]
FGLAAAANAQAEHVSGHQVSGSAAAENRENDSRLMAPYKDRASAAITAEQPNLAPDSPEFRQAVQKKLAPIVEFNSQLLKDLRCLCGCPRESLYHCKCGNAAYKRGQALAILSKHDIGTASGREKARVDVVAEFKGMAAKRERKEKGKPEDTLGSGTHVLMVVPNEGFNILAWAVPYLVLGGALVLLVGMSRRWVRSGKEQLAMNVPAVIDDEDDDEYSDLLDDELRETD